METTVGFYGITHDGKGQSKRSPYHFKLGVYDFLKKIRSLVLSLLMWVYVNLSGPHRYSIWLPCQYLGQYVEHTIDSMLLCPCIFPHRKNVSKPCTFMFMYFLAYGTNLIFFYRIVTFK